MSASFQAPLLALEYPSLEEEDFDPENDGAFSDDGDTTDSNTAMVLYATSTSGYGDHEREPTPSVFPTFNSEHRHTRASATVSASPQVSRKVQPGTRGSGGYFTNWSTVTWASAADSLVSRAGRPYTSNFLLDTAAKPAGPPPPSFVPPPGPSPADMELGDFSGSDECSGTGYDPSMDDAMSSSHLQPSNTSASMRTPFSGIASGPPPALSPATRPTKSVRFELPDGNASHGRSPPPQTIPATKVTHGSRNGSSFGRNENVTFAKEKNPTRKERTGGKKPLGSKKRK